MEAAPLFELDLIRQGTERLGDRLSTLEDTFDERARAVIGGLEEIGYGLGGIKREVTEGFDALIELGEREVSALKDITRLLGSQLDTQAAELRRRGL